MFHTNNLSAYASTINQSVDQLIRNLKAAAVAGKEVNIMQQLGQMTLQVTGAAAFGYMTKANTELRLWASCLVHLLYGALQQHE